MKHAKSHGGVVGSATVISGLLRNTDAMRTKHERVMFLEVTFSIADILNKSDSAGKHTDNRPSEIQKSEKMVSATMTNFINPFNFKRMSELNKFVKLKTSKNKVVEYKQQSNIAFQLLVKSQQKEAKLNMQHSLTYPLTTVPYSIATADGFLASTNKAKGFQHLVKGMNDAPFPPPSSTLTIMDGNYCFYYMVTKIPDNFKLICLKVFNMIPKDVDVIFSTDTYKKDSIEAMKGVHGRCLWLLYYLDLVGIK